MRHGESERCVGRCRALGLVAAMAPCVVLGACASTTTTNVGETGTSASARQHPTLENIPIPSGFTLVADRSHASNSGRLRYANCEFVGKTDPANVFSFYREYMPSAGFTLRQWRYDRGEYVLDFDSTDEQSTVRIKRQKFKTDLRIDVRPTPKGSAERDTQTPIRRPKP